MSCQFWSAAAAAAATTGTAIKQQRKGFTITAATPTTNTRPHLCAGVTFHLHLIISIYVRILLITLHYHSKVHHDIFLYHRSVLSLLLG